MASCSPTKRSQNVDVENEKKNHHRRDWSFLNKPSNFDFQKLIVMRAPPDLTERASRVIGLA
jgi:hypothetical protein